jgi:hypothetical protein
MTQSVRDYVLAKQVEFPPRRPREADIKDFAARFGVDPAGVLEDQREDYAQRLLASVVPGLPAPLRQLIDDGRVAVGEVGRDSANAYLERVGADYAILFHSGLAELLYRIARPVSTALFPEANESSLGTPQLARVVAEIFWWYQATGSAYGPAYDISKRQIVLASALATYAELFLLAHELGHIYATESPAWRAGIEVEALAAQEEHVADMAGVLTLLGAVQQGHGPYPQDSRVAYAGAELAFYVWHTMAKCGMVFVDGDHPAAEDRIEGLRVVVRQHCPSGEDYEAVTSLANRLRGLFADVADIITDPGEHDAFYEREAGVLVGELRALVQRCTGGMVPDYMTFYQEAPRLLSQGFPTVVLERVVAQAASELKAATRALPGEPGERPNRDWSEPERQAIHAWGNAFQAFKLFYGLSQHLVDPVAAVYRSALDTHMGDETDA